MKVILRNPRREIHVEKAIADHEMLQRDDRVLVAVSGGKDSLAVWDILFELVVGLRPR